MMMRLNIELRISIQIMLQKNFQNVTQGIENTPFGALKLLKSYLVLTQIKKKKKIW